MFHLQHDTQRIIAE
jgi:chromosome segregation ATPase